MDAIGVTSTPVPAFEPSFGRSAGDVRPKQINASGGRSLVADAVSQSTSAETVTLKNSNSQDDIRSEERQSVVERDARENLKEYQDESKNFHKEQIDTSINIFKDDITGDIVFQTLNDETGETVIQVPSEALLKVARSLVKDTGNFIDISA